MMMVILGLGNPGRPFAGSRHNVGSEVVDLLAKEHGIRLGDRRRYAVVGQGAIMEEEVVLARSRTYMNLSGAAAKYLMSRYQISPASLLVVYDDMDLPVGWLRIRERGGPAGHNGIKSIIEELSTQEFPRLRIGVGHPQGQDSMNHVLGAFTPDESKTVREMVSRAAEAISHIVEYGIERAMNKYNQRPDQATDETPSD